MPVFGRVLYGVLARDQRYNLPRPVGARMIGQTISHYHIVEKLGEVTGNFALSPAVIEPIRAPAG